jgi:Mg-chelatase subunit ChlD
MASDEVVLPDCGSLEDPLEVLSGAERRELLRRMAHGGTDAVEEWIEERAEEDPRWRGLLEEARQRLREELEEERERLEREHATREERIQQEYTEREQELAQRRSQLQDRLADVREERGEVVDRALETSRLGQMATGEEDEELGLLARFWRWLRRIVLRTLAFFKGLWSHREGAEVKITAPGTQAEASVDVSKALASNPAFEREARERLKQDPLKERVKRLRDRLLGRRDYDEIVADLVEQDLVEARDEELEEVQEQEQEVESEVEEVTREKRTVEREREQKLQEMQRRKREAEEELARRAEEDPIQELAGEVKQDLERVGLLEEGEPTLRMLNALSDVLFETEVEGLEGTTPAPLSRPQGAEADIQKHPLTTLEERSRLSLVDSVVNARTRHPNVDRITDQDLIVHRNTEPSRAHVVLITDISASMEESDRIGAAKRATLALHGAVHHHGPQHAVNVVLMETEVRLASLTEVWEAEPRAFTNTEGALKLARRLLLSDPADVHMVVLVTDGLPEAIMDGGEGVATHPGEARAHAVEAAKDLAKIEDLHFTTLLLEPDDEEFVEAAGEIGEVLEGDVIKTDPEDLAGDLVVEFSKGVEEGPEDAGVGLGRRL